MNGGPSGPGQTMVTTNHAVIRRWAERRGANPATMPGSEYNGHGRVDVLRFDFPRYGGAGLQPVEWEDWFATFDARRLYFRYQERGPDGSPSNFFRLERPDRPVW
ncbi:hypothetical protein [Nocardia cyriacigeorgica]|uniref:hypothetical protein n=1 Tax=Nocardia cyriacigeorgica TaxID=135487 RepID=UPI00245562FD|nr:hypothetical protein [Nocardia cyriacigeorgica]